MNTSQIQTIAPPPGVTGSVVLGFDGETTAPLSLPLTPEAIEAALNGLASIGPGGVRVAESSGDFPVYFVGVRVFGANQPPITVDSSGASASVAVVQTRARTAPGPRRAVQFRAGASLTASNIRASGGDRDAAPFLAGLTGFTVAFRLRVDEIRSAVNAGSPLPIVMIEKDGGCGFAIILQPDTGTPYDRLRVVCWARKNGSSTNNQGYYGNAGVTLGPPVGEVDPEPGDPVHFVVRVDLSGTGYALAHFRDGSFYSAEGINGAAPQYLHDDASPLQLTVGMPSNLASGYPSGMRTVLAVPGYGNSDGGDATITLDDLTIWSVPITDGQAADAADPEIPTESIDPDHQIFRLDGRGSIGAAAVLGLAGNLANRGVVALDVPRDGRIQYRDSASALADVPSSAGVPGRGGIRLVPALAGSEPEPQPAPPARRAFLPRSRSRMRGR